MVGLRPSSLLESIGANVRRTPDRRGITQQALAELAELDARFLQRVERGKTNLSVLVLARLAGALGVTPQVLLKAAKIKPAVGGRPRKVKRRTAP